MAITLTKEQIEQLLKNAQADLASNMHFAVHPGMLIALCDLALQAPTLKPAPVAETDGPTVAWGFEEGNWGET